MAGGDEVFWAVRRHALGSLRAGELLGTSLPGGIAPVAVWRNGPVGAVLFHYGAAHGPHSSESLHLETGQLRPRLKRWKWTGACGFGLSDDAPPVPADGLRLVGGTGDATMLLRAARVGAEVAAVRVVTDTRESLVPVGASEFVLLGRSPRDGLAFVVGLDRDGRELPRSGERF